jgi:hypothetical protein
MSALPRLAVIATVYYPVSHADVIVSRWTTRRPSDEDWGWPGPQSQIVSVYIQQFPANDVGREVCRKHQIPLYDTVAKALCCGGDTLAVDGVILIGEHGDYPSNELGQKMYPRAELFNEIVAVFKAKGRCVPVFNDKGYSWNPDWARQMVQTAQDMGFLLSGGSSLPGSSLRGELNPWLPGRPLREAVALYWAGNESYGYHSLELAQSLVEHRAGGESGVRSITAYDKTRFMQAYERGAWSHDLMRDALTVCQGAREGDWRQHIKTSTSDGGAAFTMEYADGLRVTHVNLDGAVRGWAVAGQDADGRRWARAARSAGAPVHYAHFATFCKRIETELTTGKSHVHPMRPLLTTLCTSSMMRAFATPGVAVPTPELAIRYTPATQG